MRAIQVKLYFFRGMVLHYSLEISITYGVSANCDSMTLLYSLQELEQSMEQQGQVQDKLRATESEIHTLKSFLTSKTAIVERRKRELERARVQLVELEEKDRRRAVILADVLEKTARQHQEQMTSPRRRSLPPSQGGDALPNRCEMCYVYILKECFASILLYIIYKATECPSDSSY